MPHRMLIAGMAGLLAGCAAAAGQVLPELPDAALPEADLAEAALPTPAPPAVLLLGDAGRLVGVDRTTGATVFALENAVASPDGRRLVQSVAEGPSTRVVERDPETGEELAATILDVGLEVRAVSGAGLVVLGPVRAVGPDPYLPEGRTQTGIVTLDLATRDVRSYDLDHNVEPEALATDGSGVFVISYLPPAAPTSYQVRRLDLATGEVGDVYSIDHELQEAMGGTARVQRWDPSGRRLYTLYTVDDPHARPERAFVHVLDLEEQWAHCVDLPLGFAGEREDAATLALSPDGRRLYAADLSVGQVAEIDTEQVAFLRAGDLGPVNDAAAATSTVLPDGRLLVGDGAQVIGVDPATLARLTTWYLGGTVAALDTSAEGAPLAVLQDRLLVLNGDSGGIVSRLLLEVPLDAVEVPAAEPPPLECAC